LVAIYEAGSWLETIIISNLILLGFFMLVRASCTYFAYGPLHAVLSAPRAVWGNLINFLATLRAMKQYLEARRKGIKNIPWEKTSHGGRVWGELFV
jgi:adsorption protein B